MLFNNLTKQKKLNRKGHQKDKKKRYVTTTMVQIIISTGE